MRANQRLDSPVMYMPKTLCKEFALYGERDGIRTELLRVENNRKRSYHVAVNGVFEKLILVPLASWSDSERIPVVSFDFV